MRFAVSAGKHARGPGSTPRCYPSSCPRPLPFHQARGPLYGAEVDVHRVFDLAGVAAGHRHGDRDAAIAAGLEDEAVALGEALLAHREPAEPVVLVRVCAGEVDGELRLRRFERLFEAVFERFEETPIVCTVGERDVEVALFL